MGLLDIFKTQWSGKDMTPEDRQKMFWYLKRKTSYTAWKREADAFDRFADIFEKQVIEEPHADGLMEGTDWDDRYPEILRAQVLFEQALKQLSKGDRTVFLYNSLGLLRDASGIAQSWYSELFNHGPQGDHFFDGKYVEAMTEAIAEFFLCSDDTGYFQPSMSGGAAPEFWGDWMKKELARVCISPDLVEVPEPEIPTLVKTGEEVPVFGVYEPQTKDGCMNYLLAGVPAPLLWDADGTSRKFDVTWRLLWEDKRYLDGGIPAEESNYFPSETKVTKSAPLVVNDDVLSALSGTLCPKSGIWAVLDDLNGRLHIDKGDLLPQHNGRDVTWVHTD